MSDQYPPADDRFRRPDQEGAAQPGDADSAQSAYDDAVAAYPQAFDRGELDTLALGAGLTLNGAQP